MMACDTKKFPQSALEAKLAGALASREQRLIRRRLPDPGPAGSPLIDFNSNDYLSLSTSRALRTHFLQKLSEAPDILGSGGSRLLVNGRAHAELETRLADFFKSEAALLFNSGFDANVGFFSCIPQPGDVVVYDEYIHASVHDGMRASRTDRERQCPFGHNSIDDLRRVLLHSRQAIPGLQSGQSNLFVAVESLYSMDGTFAPLTQIVELLDGLFPLKNAYLIVDEAHSTGIYGHQGRGHVALLGLEERVFARLHTFGKALAATGGVLINYPKKSKLTIKNSAVLLINTLVRDFLLNYARSLIYTTALSYSNIIAANCSFDMLLNGTSQRVSVYRALFMITSWNSVSVAGRQTTATFILLRRYTAVSPGIPRDSYKLNLSCLRLSTHML